MRSERAAGRAAIGTRAVHADDPVVDNGDAPTIHGDDAPDPLPSGNDDDITVFGGDGEDTTEDDDITVFGEDGEDPIPGDGVIITGDDNEGTGG